MAPERGHLENIGAQIWRAYSTLTLMTEFVANWLGVGLLTPKPSLRKDFTRNFAQCKCI